MTPPTRYLLEPRGLPKLLSFVIAIYNEEEALPFLRKRLQSFVDTLTCEAELVLVNDGSTDGSLRLLVEWANSDSRVRVLNLARNFGHQAAITAGLDHVRGGAVVVLDADLQDPPEVVASMLEEYSKGFDVIYGRRVSRAGETVFKRLSAWMFYRTMRLLVSYELPPDAGEFRMVSRKCLDAVLSMRETHRFLRGMIAWVGFPQTFVPYARESRVAGQTKYPLTKMLRLAWTAAVSFSPTPLRLSFGVGFLIAAIGMLQAANAVVRGILGLYVVPGWSSLIIVNCLVGGAILIGIGVLGEYVGRIFEAVKERPLYIVASTVARKRESDPVTEHLAILSGATHAIPSGATHER